MTRNHRPRAGSPGADAVHASPRDVLLRQCADMAAYAFASGRPVPTSVARAVRTAAGAAGTRGLDGPDISRLIAAHEELARIVAPATPRALALLAQHRADGGWTAALGPVPLVRRMMALAVLSLLAFVVLLALPQVTGDFAPGGVRDGGVWVPLGNVAFLLSAAAMGSAFGMLVQANRYVTERTYDPQHDISYWIRFVVGLIAGLMLCLMLPVDWSGGDPSHPAGLIDQPLLALLGGFSAPVVHRMLSRLVKGVESLVLGSEKARARAAEAQSRMRAEALAEQLQGRMAADLVSLQSEVRAGGDPARLGRTFEAIFSRWLPERLTDAGNALAASPRAGTGPGND